MSGHHGHPGQSKLCEHPMDAIHHPSITNTITNTKNNSNTTKHNFQTTTGRGELELRKLLSPIGRRYLHQINGLLHDSG